jgi:predicted ArsR family transcriptional regulator
LASYRNVGIDVSQSISPAAYRILSLLVGNPPQSVAQLTRASGVTRTAVIEQLNELMAQGFVARRVDKTQRRGRPRHLYSATDVAIERIFPPSPHILPAVVQAIESCGGPQLRREVFSHLGQVLVQRYRPKVQALAPRQRLEQLSQLLEYDGVLTSVEVHDGKLTLRERSCPFVNMLDCDRTACDMESSMIADLVGCKVTLAECRLDGCPSCLFQLEFDDESQTATATSETQSAEPLPAEPPVALQSHGAADESVEPSAAEQQAQFVMQ